MIVVQVVLTLVAVTSALSAYQVFLLVVTAVVGVLAARRAVEILR